MSVTSFASPVPAVVHLPNLTKARHSPPDPAPLRIKIQDTGDRLDFAQYMGRNRDGDSGLAAEIIGLVLFDEEISWYLRVIIQHVRTEIDTPERAQYQSVQLRAHDMRIHVLEEGVCKTLKLLAYRMSSSNGAEVHSV